MGLPGTYDASQKDCVTWLQLERKSFAEFVHCVFGGYGNLFVLGHYLRSLPFPEQRRKVDQPVDWSLEWGSISRI